MRNVTRVSKTFDGKSYGVTAAEAERGNTAPQIAALQFVQESDQDASAARSDRMADRYRSAVHVHFLGIEF